MGGVVSGLSAEVHEFPREFHRDFITIYLADFRAEVPTMLFPPSAISVLLHARRSDYPDTRRVSGPTAVTGLSDRNRISCQARRPWVASPMDKLRVLPDALQLPPGADCQQCGQPSPVRRGACKPAGRGACAPLHRQEKYHSRFPVGRAAVKMQTSRGAGIGVGRTTCLEPMRIVTSAS